MAYIQERGVEAVVALDRADYLAIEAQHQTSYEIGQKVVELAKPQCSKSESCELEANEIPSPWGSIKFSCGALACGDVSICQQVAPDAMVGITEQLCSVETQ